MAKFRFDMNKPGAALGGALAQMPSTQRPAAGAPIPPGSSMYRPRPATGAPLPPNTPVFQPRRPERRPPIAPPVQGRPQDNMHILPYPFDPGENLGNYPQTTPPNENWMPNRPNNMGNNLGNYQPNNPQDIGQNIGNLYELPENQAGQVLGRYPQNPAQNVGINFGNLTPQQQQMEEYKRINEQLRNQIHQLPRGGKFKLGGRINDMMPNQPPGSQFIPDQLRPSRPSFKPKLPGFRRPF